MAADDEAQAERRSRSGPQEPLRDAIIGYVEDGGDDPAQSGVTAPRQSREIQSMVSTGLEVPIAKDKRAGFVWVAAARRAQGARKRYTWNVDEMEPLAPFKQAADNTCDICGASCSEVLYEFRCYRRRQRARQGGDADAAAERRLHPFVSYISKECGRGLLGAQSELSRLREHLYKVVSEGGETAVETLRELWKFANKAQKRVIQEELRHFARAEAGETQRAAELRSAEALRGPLNRSHEDPFRALARSLAPALTARELAAVTMKAAVERDEVPDEAYFERLVESIEDWQPLPLAQPPWSKDMVEASIRLVLAEWPLRVELFDSLGGQEVFEPVDGMKPKVTVQLVFLAGCGELHSLAGKKVDKEKVLMMKKGKSEILAALNESHSHAGNFMGQRGCSKAQDKQIEVPAAPAKIPAVYVRTVLESITWPCCFTRNNVKPDDVPTIQAFPLGLVLNYAFGLCASRTVKLWPNLTSLLTRFIAQDHPTFRYTTIQLNRDYSAKMHVDGNNHGPSYITGFGEYTGGQLWIMDEAGDVEVEVTDALRGWPHLKVGEKIRGRLEDIKGRWLKFDGNTPHQAMPFQGQRISIVYFSRKGFINIPPDAFDSLERLGFRLPGEENLAESTCRSEASEAAAAAPAATSSDSRPVAAAPPSDDEDEVDEDEEVDAVMCEELDSSAWRGRGWAEAFRQRLGIAPEAWTPSPEDRPLGVCVFGVPTGAPLFALQELLPGGAGGVRALSFSGIGASALRYCRLNCKPEHLTSGNFGPERGARGAAHCEVHHKSCEAPAMEDEDLFVASFSSMPFQNRDASRRQSCFDDPRSVPYWRIRRHIDVRRPRAAVLEVADFDELPDAVRSGVLSFMSEGADPRTSAPWGLRTLSGYGVAFFDVALADYGLPRAERRVHVVLVREDAGGQEAADAIGGLTRALAGAVPSCSAQDIMFEEDDTRLLEAARARAAAGGTPRGAALAEAAAKAGLDEEFVQHFPHASPAHVELLALAHQSAEQGGLDLRGMFADLGQDARARAWRDDGLLPPSRAEAGGAGGPRYSFARRRPMLGQEELLCHGFPVWRLNFQGMSDEQCMQLAAGAMPVTVIGATLCAVLAACDLSSGQGARGGWRVGLRAPKEQVAALVGGARPPDGPVAATQAALDKIAAARAAATAGASSMEVEEAKFEGRAAALLSIVSHGAFGKDAEGEAGVGKADPKKPTEVAKAMLTSLGRVAVGASGADQDESGGGDGPVGGALGLERQNTEEPLDWSTRLRKLRVSDGLPWAMVVRWLAEAMDDPEAPLAQDLILAAAAHLRRRLTAGGGAGVSEETLQAAAAGDVQTALRSAGREAEAKDFDELLRATRFTRTLASGDARFKISAQTPETMPRYIATVVQGCDRNSWQMRRALLDHLAQAATGRGAAVLAEFGRRGGWDPMARWLQEAPADLKKTWAAGGATLQALSSFVPVKNYALLLAMYAADSGQGTWQVTPKSAQRIEAAMVERAVHAISAGDAPEKVAVGALQAFAESDTPVGARFKRTLMIHDLVERVRGRMQDPAARQTSLQEWQRLARELDEGLASPAPAAPAPAGACWARLAAAEEATVASARGRLEEQLKRATAQSEQNQVAARAVEEHSRARAAEEVADRLLALFSDVGSIRSSTPEAFQSFQAALQASLAANAACKEPPKAAVEAADMGRRAALRYAEQPIRALRARRWLAGAGLSHCAPLLDDAGLLDCLADLARDAGGGGPLSRAARARAVPETALAELAAALASGKMLDQDMMPPCAAPPGWDRRCSRTTGVFYFQALGAPAGGSGEAEMQWPLTAAERDELEKDRRAAPGELDASEDASYCAVLPLPESPSPAAPAAAEGSGARRAAYLDETPMGDHFCVLCSRTGRRHLHTTAHAAAVEHWAALAGTMEGILGKLATGSSSSSTAGAASSWAAGGAWPNVVGAWRGELRRIFASAEAPRRVKGAWWHRVVAPRLSSALGADGDGGGLAASISKCLRAMVEDAKVPELDGSLPREVGVVDAERLRLVESATRRLQAWVNPEGALKQDSLEGLNGLIGCIRELRARLVECGAQPPAEGLEELAAAENAVRAFCERPAKRLAATAWLESLGLGHCVQLLWGRGLLERLPELVAHPAHMERSGLSRRCRALLESGAERCRLMDMHLVPTGAPPGWKRAFSRSVGMEYFVEVGAGQRTQWEWPLPEGVGAPAVEGAGRAPPTEPLVEPPEPRRPKVGAPMDGAAAYVEFDLTCQPFCLLCAQAGHKHLSSPEHARSRSAWELRVAHLEALLSEATALATICRQGSSPCRPGLAEAWVGELLAIALGVGSALGEPRLAPQDAVVGVASSLWHCIICPRLPQSPAGPTDHAAPWAAELVECLRSMAAVARAPEPGSV